MNKTKEIMGIKNGVFADTSAFIAMRVFDDKKHTAAKTALNLVQKKNFILHTSNFILDEVYTYFCKHHDIAMEMANLILKNPLIRMHRITVEDEHNTLKILERFHDKTFSYTDATTFAIMKRLELNVAFSYDQHFAQYGKFDLL